MRRVAPALLALPGVALAVIGTTHPTVLTQETAHHWWVMHLIALPVFPLLGYALWWVVRGRGPAAWAAGLLAYGYALAYTALDLLAGVGAGYVADMRPGADTSPLFGIGNELGYVGAYAFLGLAAVVLVVVFLDALPGRDRIVALVGGLVLLAASVSFLDSHIYRWRGVVTVLLIGLATAVLGLVEGRRRALVPAQVDDHPDGVA